MLSVEITLIVIVFKYTTSGKLCKKFIRIWGWFHRFGNDFTDSGWFHRLPGITPMGMTTPDLNQPKMTQIMYSSVATIAPVPFYGKPEQ